MNAPAPSLADLEAILAILNKLGILPFTVRDIRLEANCLSATVCGLPMPPGFGSLAAAMLPKAIPVRAKLARQGDLGLGIEIQADTGKSAAAIDKLLQALMKQAGAQRVDNRFVVDLARLPAAAQEKGKQFLQLVDAFGRGQPLSCVITIQRD